jgi:aryl-alcohol dehydrogenase-like predicted oxidoreductase
MSNFAFGTYRITDLNPQHIEALKEAISSGITMIDTSTNYMDGGAERAIALAFREYEDKIQDIEIVSKFGYIQGSNLENYKDATSEDIVKYSLECYHCISEDFLKEQLSQSLNRLEREKLDCYLIHNPEYYLLDAIKKGINLDDRLDEMYKRIELAFIALEKEVKNNRINSYGISSNSFSKDVNDEEFLPYEDLMTLAQNACEIAGNKKHSFTTIQLPINLLELEGLKCVSWAKKNTLRVLANRPLNANLNSTMYRLAEYDEPMEYYHHLNELLEVTDNDTLRPLYNLLEQLDEFKHKFAWIGDYDTFLYTQIIPHIKTALEVVDEKNKDTMFNFIDLFLQEYKKMVAYECGKTTKSILATVFEKCDGSMQVCALNFLLQNDDIDYILVGMRKPSYVFEILSLKE